MEPGQQFEQQRYENIEDLNALYNHLNVSRDNSNVRVNPHRIARDQSSPYLALPSPVDKGIASIERDMPQGYKDLLPFDMDDEHTN